MAYYSIKDLETFTGIKAHTLRIWEKRYSVVEPERTHTNIRTYDDDDLKRLLNVSILNRHGYRISEIIRLTDIEISEKVIQISQRSADTDSQIENLVIAMIDMNEERFDKALTQSIIKMGFEETVLYLIYPFFERIGILWQAGSIVPAQEHFITSLIRQKIIAAIDSIMAPRKDKAKNCLLLLREGEWHEMGLLFTHYMLKKWGHRVLYLGQSVPLPECNLILQKHPVEIVVTQFVTGALPEELQEQIQLVADVFPEQRILVSGLQIEEKKPLLPANVFTFRKPGELKELVEYEG